MGEIINIYHGKRVRNLDAYFLEDGTYIEEFDTDDGKHWIGGASPQEYPDDVREEALELGIIDINGNVIPMKDSQED